MNSLSITYTRQCRILYFLLLLLCANGLAGQPADTLQAAISLRQAQVFVKSSQPDSAIVYFKQAAALYGVAGKWGRSVTVANDAATHLRFHGLYDDALQVLLSAAKLARRNLGQEHAELARSYYLLSSVFRKLGDNEEALSYQQQALTLRIALLGEDDLEVGKSYNVLGNIFHSMGNTAAALESYRKSLQIKQNKLGYTHRSVAVAYHNIATMHYILQEYPEAIAAYDRAVSIEKLLPDADSPAIALTYTNMALLYDQLGDSARVFQYFDSTLTLQRRVLGDNHPDLAGTYHNIGEMHLKRGSIARALSFFDLAIRANVPGLPQDFSALSLTGQSVLRRDYLLKSLVSRAKTLRLRAADTASGSPDLREALRALQQAAELVEDMQRRFREEGSRLGLAARASGMYEQAIQIALELWRSSGLEEDLVEAFRLAGSGKARVLQDALAENAAATAAAIPGDLLKKEQQLRDSLAYFDTQLQLQYQKAASEERSRQLAQLHERRFAQHLAYRELIEVLEQQYPAYHQLKYQLGMPHPRQVCAALAEENRLLLSYFSGSDSLYLFSFAGDGFEVAVAPLPEKQSVSVFTDALFNGDHEEYQLAARQLYQQLLTPVSHRLAGKQLIVIPDGSLYYLAFEALPASPQQGAENWRYLIEEHEVRYDISVAHAIEKSGKEKPGDAWQLAAFAPVFSDSLQNGRIPSGLALFPADDGDHVFAAIRRSVLLNDSTLAPLAASREEVRRIGKLFRNRGLSAVAQLNAAASEAALKALEPRANRILHIATHAFVNERQPELSGIFFSQHKSPSVEDGVLFVRELYGLNLEADLVVLSACETGRGNIALGEGLMGFSRGFLYAGARNLLVSLWEVGDASTSELMVSFYEHLLAGSSNAQALRLAKLSMLQQGRYREPYFWAPFVLIGQ